MFLASLDVSRRFGDNFDWCSCFDMADGCILFIVGRTSRTMPMPLHCQGQTWQLHSAASRGSSLPANHAQSDGEQFDFAAFLRNMVDKFCMTKMKDLAKQTFQLALSRQVQRISIQQDGLG